VILYLHDNYLKNACIHIYLQHQLYGLKYTEFISC